MPWYGKYEESETESERIAREVKRQLKKKEEYDGGNLRAIKASTEDDSETKDS